MQRPLLLVSLLAALSAPALASSPTLAMQAKSSAARSVWLVHFSEEPLAGYRGPGTDAAAKRSGPMAGLAATSPAVTGEARLNVDSAPAKAYRAALAQVRQSRLADAAQRIGRPLQPVFVYDVASNGVALELTESEARALADVDGIRSIEPDFVREPATDAGPTWIKANALWGVGPNAANGNRGEGQVVGIIDTGINAAHRSFSSNSNGYTIQNPRAAYLGLCASSTTAGCNGKLIGIYDFTTSGSENKETDDGSDQNGHGTHVASTAAGNTTTVSFASGVSATLSGVAPRANLISYKGCEVESKCMGSWLLAAIDQAVADKVDVINYSIGGDGRDPWKYSDTMAMLKARDAGIVVAVAAGNEGPAPGSHTSPGNAPWVIGVANVSHNRANVSSVTLSGGASAPPSNGVLRGASQTTTAYGPASIVYAGQFGSALCATGPDVDATPPSTTTSPWNGQVFNGQIVVCDRGTYARLIKGLNVKNAGGGGMVLVNQAAEGNALVADAHELPASHLGYADGVALKAWLASGSGHMATISASKVEKLDAFGDILASSSGRGPTTGDWLKPNLAAPGTDILAAYKPSGGNAQQYAYLSGTSMATPHVAGAVALLRKAHPDWTPEQVESALQTTARDSVRLPDGVTPAGVLDAGAGTIDVSKAVNAALYFPVSGSQFRQASPSIGGDPRTLNLPSLVNSACFVSCSFTRTVKDMGGGGRWVVQTEVGTGALTVSPSQFDLAAGGSQTLTFTYTPDASTHYGEWTNGRVILSSSGKPDAALPVAIRPSAGSLPAVAEEKDVGESGWTDLVMSGLVALPSARFSASDLVRPLTAAPTIAQDATPDDRYDGLTAAAEGTDFFRLTATRTGRMRFRTEAFSDTSPDIDLFVGSASSATALPSEATELCASTREDANELCDIEIDVTAGDRFWIRVQNWQASAAGKDTVSIASALIPLEPAQTVDATPTLRATGPGQVGQGDAFTARIGWDDPGFAQGQSRWGHIFLGANDDEPTGVGEVLVKLSRSLDAAPASALLLPGAVRAMALAPGKAQDRLYIDVPTNAGKLTVTSTGEGDVTLYLAYSPVVETSPVPGMPGPVIVAAPPRTSAAAFSTQAGANDTVSVSGSVLSPGRWYITPVNNGTTTADFRLTATLDYAVAPEKPGFGNWYNPSRSGSGFLLSPVGDGTLWAVSWYTYLEDGTPTWYLGTGPAPSGNGGSFVFDINRFSWNGTRPIGTVVGHGMLSLEDASSMQFSWNLDGESGTQSVIRIDAGSCQGVQGKQQPDGNWYDPAHSGFGYDINAYPNLESVLAYLYDGLGQPRWLQASSNGNPTVGTDVSMDLTQRTGACPLCSMGQTTQAVVGSLTRRYLSPTTGQLAIDVAFGAPVPGLWSQDTAIRMLTMPRSCP